MSHSKGYAMLSIAETIIRKHEGIRKFPYKCTSNFLTIGVGRNLDTKGLRDDEIELLLANDIAECVADLEKFTFWPGLSAVRKAALIDLAFCVGSGAGFRAFKKMRAAFEAKYYPLAAQEIRKSKFALQTGRRAEDLARMLTDDAIS
jgi:lysozyme